MATVVQQSEIAAAVASIDAYTPYLSWAEDTLGVRTTAGLAVSTLPQPYGRGFVATGHIRKGSTLVTVPLDAVLSALALESHPVGPIVKVLVSAGVGLVEDDVLAIMLVYEKLLGPRSTWSKHIAALPTDINSPFFWSDDELEAFASTNLYPTARQMRAQVRIDYDAIAGAMRSEAVRKVATTGIMAPHEFTFELYRWAIGTVWSRFVSVRINRRYYKSIIPGESSVLLFKVSALDLALPLIIQRSACGRPTQSSRRWRSLRHGKPLTACGNAA